MIEHIEASKLRRGMCVYFTRMYDLFLPHQWDCLDGSQYQSDNVTIELVSRRGLRMKVKEFERVAVDTERGKLEQ